MKVDPSLGAESLRPQIRPKRGAGATSSTDKSLTQELLHAEGFQLALAAQTRLSLRIFSFGSDPFPSIPPLLHPIAKACLPVCLPTFFLKFSLYLHRFLSPWGSAANRVCCLQRIPKALRYKGAVIEWLGRTLLKEIFVSVSTHHHLSTM